jgi:hypothetical protein
MWFARKKNQNEPWRKVHVASVEKNSNDLLDGVRAIRFKTMCDLLDVFFKESIFLFFVARGLMFS